MQVIRREGDNLKINEKVIGPEVLFKKIKGGRNHFVSFDLTITFSVFVKKMMINYEYVESFEDLKTDTQWTVIESPVCVYGVFTKYAKWTSLVSMMGLDSSEEDVLRSFNVNSIEELYIRAEKMGLTSLTLAGASMKTFKYYIEEGKLILLGKTYDRQEKISMDEWRGYKPSQIPFIDMMFRPGYRGGITWGVSGLYPHVCHIDRRSMYPTTASYYPMPYGIPHSLKEEDSDIKIVRPSGILFIKKGSIPMIGFANPVQFRRHAIKGRMGALLTDVNLPGDIWFYEFEWETIVKMYEFYGIIEEEMFVSTKEPKHLQIFFGTCYNIKSQSKKGSDPYIAAKKRANATYGKFSIKTMRKTVTYKAGKRTQINKEVEDLSYYHLPLGCSITAHARVDLIEMAIKIGLENVLYMDTDSIFFKKEAFPDRDKMLKTCDISQRMGGWDLEEEDITLNVIGPKTYQTLTIDNKVTTKCAGLPTDVSNTIPWLGLKEGMVVEVTKNKRGKDMIIHPQKGPHKISCRPTLLK